MSNECFKFGASGVECCEVTCEFLRDLVTRPNSDDPGIDWQERVGDWDVLTNRISVSTANAILLSLKPATATIGNINICHNLNSVSGNDIRHIVNYIDDDNFYFSEVRVGSPAASWVSSLKKRVAGVETLLCSRSFSFPGQQPSSIVTCLTEYGQFQVGLGNANYALDTTLCSFGGSVARYKLSKAEVVSNQWGLGTGSQVLAAVGFDNILGSLNNLEDDCPLCWNSCVACIDYHPWDRLRYDLSGIANGTCAFCNKWDGIYNTPALTLCNSKDFNCLSNISGFSIPAPNCDSAGPYTLGFFTQILSPANPGTPDNRLNISVQLFHSFPLYQHVAIFRKNSVAKLDCRNWNNEVFTFISEEATGSGGAAVPMICSFAPATLKVTSFV